MIPSGPWAVLTARATEDESPSEPQLRIYDHLLDRRQPFVVVWDSRKGRSPEAGLLKQQGRWIEERTADLQRYCLGVAFVIPSPLLRGVLKAAQFLRPMPVPIEVRDTMTDAVDWAVRRLLDAGLTLPDGLRSSAAARQDGRSAMPGPATRGK